MYSYSNFVYRNPQKNAFLFERPLSQDYKVFVNEKEIPVYTCQISKFPFNTVWP